MSKVEDFLTTAEEQEIVAAIGMAEKNTSGEIRVHIEKETSMAPIERAVEVFNQLQMQQTQERNGVLIYLAVKSKQFAICGDEGIDQKVPTDFWDTTKDIMVSHFKNGNFKHGLIDGILKAGEQLKTHFPYQSDDTNELSNEISKG
ncbi:TPM domain-containing protein [Flavobacterium phycosphaerae]|uniref:TPM domain-containing protein n=1 Tax=Flavobacterium phycosphaerae TaxID=2697515 RepID=UPI001389C0FE|nr:TPM domain-containing protein [Flavobacterium phycosphaerae]